MLIIGYSTIAATVIVVLHACTGCAAADSQEAKYTKALGECELAKTCAEAVVCRAAKANEFHRTFTGHCEPFSITDAGGN